MRQKSTLRSYQRYHAWAMGLPGLVILFTFVALPLALGAYWSVTNKRLISPIPTQFVGAANYQRLLGVRMITLEGVANVHDEEIADRLRTTLRSDPQLQGYREWFRFTSGDALRVVVAGDLVFMRSLRNTLVFVAWIVPGQGGLALLMALLINRKIRGVHLFRTIYFAPVVTSMAVIAIVWTFLYNPQQGLINAILSRITGGRFAPVGWLIEPETALGSIILVSAWQAAGFQMVIFLAGLQSIPGYLYEAARIDGAGAFQQFRYVTFPQLRNTTIFVVITTTILAFRVFTQIDVMTRGGPQSATSSVVYYAVEQGFRQQRIGYASAVTMLFFVIVLLVALIQRLLLRSEKEIA